MNHCCEPQILVFHREYCYRWPVAPVASSSSADNRSYRPIATCEPQCLLRPPGAPYRQPLGGVHLDHTAQQVLTVGRDEVWHMENSQLHLLQEVPQVVVVEWQSPLQEGSGITPKTSLSVHFIHRLLCFPRACRASAASPLAVVNGVSSEANSRLGRKILGRKRLTTSSANRMTPQLHASAFLPSYFSPWRRSRGRGINRGGREETESGEM